jgi:Spy/CpxP family protein refolding chaperone
MSKLRLGGNAAMHTLVSSRSRLALVVTLLSAVGCGGSQEKSAAAPAAPSATAPAKPVAQASAAPSAAAAPVVSAKPSSSAAPAVAAAAPAASPAKLPTHPRTIPDFFLVALGGIELKPEQKATIQSIEVDLDKIREAPRAARQQLIVDLADGVGANKLDEAKLDMDIGALRESVSVATPTLQDATNRLHHALDPEQRKKLVEVLRDKVKSLRQRDASETLMSDAMGPGASTERVKALGQKLQLTPDQEQKLKPKLEPQFQAQAGALKERLSFLATQLSVLADAFLTDKFDAKQVGVGVHAPDLVLALAKNRLEFVKTLLPVLTPEQCTKFAEELRARAGSLDDVSG